MQRVPKCDCAHARRSSTTDAARMCCATACAQGTVSINMRRQASAHVRRELRCKQVQCKRSAAERPATA
eukprot:12289327-Alexandrium_andersonii.AAC.1